MANLKTGPSNYIGDNYEYTAPVKTFPPSSLGLFDIAGNVSEWKADNFEFKQSPVTAISQVQEMQNFNPELKVVKGGRWADYKYAAMCGSRIGLEASKGYSRVGFRVARNN